MVRPTLFVSGSILALLCLFACVSAPVDNAIGVVGADAVPTQRDVEERVLLAVPHISQERNLCVATSAAMVMTFFGDPHPPRELKVLSRGKVFDPEAPFTDFTLTWYRDLIAGIERIGYSWREETFPANSPGFDKGLARLKTSLRAGRPVLVDVALYRSHTFVIIGFDDTARSVFVRNPNLASPGFRVLSFDQLKSIWHGRSYGLNARPALFTEPAA